MVIFDKFYYNIAMQGQTDFHWPIIGHERIKEFLQVNLSNRSLAHAYIFEGPEKMGKTLTARLFAKSILCENYSDYTSPAALVNKRELDVLPCDKCEHCRQFEKGIYADVYFIEREVSEKTGEKRGFITVNQVRDLQDKISKRAFLNSYKIVIVKDAHYLNAEASNSLLKTLEEPTDKTILILITLNKNLLLPTIISRCQTVKFLPITKEAIYNYLIENGANRSDANELSSLAEGRPTVAMQLFASKERRLDFRKRVEDLLKIFESDTKARFEMVEKMITSNNNEDILKRLDELFGVMRDLVMVNLYNNQLIAHQDLLGKIEEMARKFSLARLISALGQIEKTKSYLRQNVNPKLALENLIINI